MKITKDSGAIIIDFWNFQLGFTDTFLDDASNGIKQIWRINWGHVPDAIVSEFHNLKGKDVTVEAPNVKMYISVEADDYKLKGYMAGIRDRFKFSIIESERVTRYRKCHHCRKDSTVRVEKGVDVSIALDIVLGNYKTVFLLSSDTDLIPAIKKAKEMGRRVIYVGSEKFWPSFEPYCFDKLPLESIVGRITSINPKSRQKKVTEDATAYSEAYPDTRL